MNDTETVIMQRDGKPVGSHVFGVSVRGWLAWVLVATICFSHLTVAGATAYHSIRTGDFSLMGTLTTIGEPLYSMAIAALGFYFGNQKATGK